MLYKYFTEKLLGLQDIEIENIDEFKGNTNGEKYQCILTAPVNQIVLDILPMRYEHYLTQYFNSFDKADREKVMLMVIVILSVSEIVLYISFLQKLNFLLKQATA